MLSIGSTELKPFLNAYNCKFTHSQKVECKTKSMYSYTLSSSSNVFFPSRTSSISSQLGRVKQNDRSSSDVPEAVFTLLMSLFLVATSHCMSSISFLRFATYCSSLSSLNWFGSNSLKSNRLSFFPSSKSHMRLEMGKSISLLSTMLFAMKVPANLKRSVISFSQTCVSDLTSIGVGNKVPSDWPIRHILPSLAE